MCSLSCPLLPCRVSLLGSRHSVNLRGADEDDPNLQDEEGEEGDEENEDLGGLPSMQQYHQQQEMSMERRSQAFLLLVPCLLRLLLETHLWMFGRRLQACEGVLPQLVGSQLSPLRSA